MNFDKKFFVFKNLKIQKFYQKLIFFQIFEFLSKIDFVLKYFHFDQKFQFFEIFEF